MDYINNQGEKIGSLTVAIGKEKTVTINRLNDVTTVTTQDRTTGKFSTETFFGDSPFGKEGQHFHQRRGCERRGVLRLSRNAGE